MTSSRLDNVQNILLMGIFAFLIVTVPTNWIQFPDSGYYLATSENMLNGLGYWFNGYPNLQYYPGTSTVIAIPLFLFGLNFTLLQGFMALISLTGVFLISRYYPTKDYGLVGFFTPLLVLSSSIFSIQIYALLSDALFLTLSMIALVLWREYDKSKSYKMLWLCALVVALAPLVRLQGLFLIGAFGLSLLVNVFTSSSEKRTKLLIEALIIGILVMSPFALWTLRNYMLHSPDTFNMANNYFFGLEGLSIYAKGLQGDVSAEHVSSVWEFVYLRTTLFMGGLFESWYGGMSQLSRTIVTLFMLTISALGLKPWARRASKIELIYVGISLLYLAKGILAAKNLHIVYRYWVPMLPFIIIIMGLGISKLVNLSVFGKWRIVPRTAGMLLATLLLITGSLNLTDHITQSEKYEIEAQAVARLTEFAQQNLPQDAVVATVDWGILPRALQRQSYQVLNDPSFIQTVTRMAKYQTKYLVTYGKFARMNDPAKAMIAAYTELFDKQFSVFDDKPNTQIEVYKVDIDRLASEILKDQITTGADQIEG
ncbi:hypothetical protein [Aliiglaciecola litoralis]|uniref:Glycosyltransferase RgtA/B/C/D-like domain-containing protein n=1 Tax=Aliiglaciecola litoralis TaxID=582857 RepID=A0ABN1LJZ8_9ALTE